jgi:hypothetical protein
MARAEKREAAEAEPISKQFASGVAPGCGDAGTPGNVPAPEASGPSLRTQVGIRRSPHEPMA